MKKRILLVTGASSDMGCELIRRVYKEYDAVWAHYCCAGDKIERIRDEAGGIIKPIQADFSNEGSTKALISAVSDSEWIPNSIVHFASSRLVTKQFYKCSWEDYEQGINTSLRSIMMILSSFIEKMGRDRYGRIVFLLTSYLCGIEPRYQSPYITTKYALYGLMKNLAAEYADKGMTVNGVSPDMVETKFLSNVPPGIVKRNGELSPIKRNLTVHDVIPVIKYFLSDESEAVTGENFAMKGGR